MLKKTAFVLVMATVSVVNANCLDRICSGGFDNIQEPIEFAASNTFANIAIGRSDGRRPGFAEPIEFASTIVKPEVEACKHNKCPMNIVNIS
ncbi:hypothetical protein [Spartinivicinus poritis]|uniref:Uncharacterized protein n=1 Tax=Spartinivicinus poritis TaxID=2994640 RepID=A0ABT5UD85_9GAMM|nr:hypothetical protein [Spartinivicinus sp. A2-2]MDE1464330.1 hypothetical protein [Spartinivicinus sp. A2-2]